MVDPEWCLLIFIALSFVISILVYLRCSSSLPCASTSCSCPETGSTSVSPPSPSPLFVQPDAAFSSPRDPYLSLARSASVPAAPCSFLSREEDAPPSFLSEGGCAETEVSSSSPPTLDSFSSSSPDASRTINPVFSGSPSTTPRPSGSSSKARPCMSAKPSRGATLSPSSSSCLLPSSSSPPKGFKSSSHPPSSPLPLRTAAGEHSTDDYCRFRRSYLTVYLLAQASEWIQGPFMYSFYSSTCHLSLHEVGLLFFVEYAANGLFGCILGSVADVLGRRNVCFLYSLLCIVSCFLTRCSSSLFSLLLLGRLVGGIALSILETIFEVYMIDLFNENHFPDQWLHDTLSTCVFSNGLLACFSGFFASFLAKCLSDAACFDAACLLAALSALALFLLTRDAPKQQAGREDRRDGREKKEDTDGFLSHPGTAPTKQETGESTQSTGGAREETRSQEEQYSREGMLQTDEGEEEEVEKRNVDRDAEGGVGRRGEEGPRGEQTGCGTRARLREDEEDRKEELVSTRGVPDISRGGGQGVPGERKERETGAASDEDGSMMLVGKADRRTQLQGETCTKGEEVGRKVFCRYGESKAAEKYDCQDSACLHRTPLDRQKEENEKNLGEEPRHGCTSCRNSTISRWVGFVSTCNDVYVHLKTSVKFILHDKQAQQCGFIQIFFEVPMSIFFILWTPALDSRMDHGLIFSCFMASVVLGSELFHQAIHRLGREDFKVLRDFLLLGSIALFIPSTTMLHTPRFISFCLFEAVCGVYYPCMALLRVKMIPDHKRATVMNLFRLPLNVLIIIVYGWGADVQFSFLFFLCASMVLIAALVCSCLGKQKNSPKTPLLAVV